MPVFRTAGIRSTGSPLPGVVNPSPGTVYPTSGLAAAGQFAIPNQQTLQAVRTTTAPAGVLGGQFGGGPMARPTPITTALQQGYARETQTILPRPQQGQFGMPQNVSNILNKPYQGSVASLTGANNSVGVNQYNYLTPQQKAMQDAEKRRQQINQLTTPYTGSLAAITGANMVEPSRQGFPGTDPRQPLKIANPYIQSQQVQQNASNLFAGVYGESSGSNGYGSNGYTGYTDYGNNGGYSSAYDPNSSWYGSAAANTLNWRVATG